MKLKHSLPILGLVAMLGLGVGVGLASEKANVQEAKAGTNTFYLIDELNCFSTSPYAYVYGGSGEELGTWGGTQMSQVQGKSHIFYVDFPENNWSTHTAIIFHGNDKQTNDLYSSFEGASSKNAFITTGLDGSGKVIGEFMTLDTSYDYGYYLKGKFDDWGSGQKMTVSSGTATVNGIDIDAGTEEDDGIQVVFESSSSESIWVCAAGSGVAGNNKYPVSTQGNNAVVTYSNTYNVSVNLSTRAYTLTPTKFYKVVVTTNNDSDEYTLDPKAGGFSQTLTSITANAVVSVTYDDVVQVFTVNELASNNIRTDKTIKVGGSNIYVWLSSSLEMWLDGYKLNSENLSNFCAEFIQYTINAGTCSNPTGTTVRYNDQDVYTWTYFTNWYNNLGDDRQAFIDAVRGARLGNDVSYSNVLDEAACRYYHLVSKFPSLTAFSDVVTPNSRVIPNDFNANGTIDNTVIIIIAAVSGVSLIAVAGYFFLKRKEDR